MSYLSDLSGRTVEPYGTTRFSDEKFRRAVASLECQACGAVGRTQAAHSNRLADGKGMGIKAPDETLMALCVDCHTSLDQGGKMTKAERHVWEAELNLKTLRALISRRLVVTK